MILVKYNGVSLKYGKLYVMFKMVQRMNIIQKESPTLAQWIGFTQLDISHLTIDPRYLCDEWKK